MIELFDYGMTKHKMGGGGTGKKREFYERLTPQ
jgi:hypothetical protein